MSVGEAETVQHKRTPSRAKRPRSAVTSGRQMFVQGDPNSAWSRRYHDLVVRHVGDLGGRSAGPPRSSVSLNASTPCYRPAPRWIWTLTGRASSHLRRLFETLGIERRARDVTRGDDEGLQLFSPMRARWAEAEAVKVTE